MSSSSVYFTRHDFILIGHCEQVFLPTTLCNKKQEQSIETFKKFYTKTDLDIVDYVTNQYAVINTLRILKHGYDLGKIQANSSGLSINEITNFILDKCQYTLPVNIVTNTPLLSSICKYIFMSPYLDVGHWKYIPQECCKNKKCTPKVVVWQLVNRVDKNKSLNMFYLKEFIRQFPNHDCKYIMFKKKHTYISNKYSVGTNNIREEEEEEEEIKLPFSFLLKQYGGWNCLDQGTIQCVVKLILSPNFFDNNSIRETFSYLEGKRFVNIYT